MKEEMYELDPVQVVGEGIAEKVSFVRATQSNESLLCQLAEECCELAQAALKLRRVLVGDSPTPVTQQESSAAVIEEIADVKLLMTILGDAECEGQISDRQRKRLGRWVQRLETQV